MQRSQSSPRSHYTGPVRAVILDWAGTTLDYGSCAPLAAFIETFKRAGVLITPAEARQPMGRAKLDHIQEILEMPAVAERWQQAKGRASSADDCRRLYEAFLPVQLESLADYAALIPGTLDLMKYCRAHEIKVGTSTGYSRALMETLIPLAEKQGYAPDAMVCIDDVPEGRPAPWMQFENAKRLNVFPMESIVTVDDTRVGIQAGINAGTWTVAVAKTGNEVGLTETQIQRLPEQELDRRLAAAYERLCAAGAHYVVDGIADLAAAIDEINQRLAHGERP